MGIKLDVQSDANERTGTNGINGVINSKTIG